MRLRDVIERLVLESPGYGYRRVARQLHRDGWEVNHKHILRVMREESLPSSTPTSNHGTVYTVYIYGR